MRRPDALALWLLGALLVGPASAGVSETESGAGRCVSSALAEEHRDDDRLRGEDGELPNLDQLRAIISTIAGPPAADAGLVERKVWLRQRQIEDQRRAAATWRLACEGRVEDLDFLRGLLAEEDEVEPEIVLALAVIGDPLGLERYRQDVEAADGCRDTLFGARRLVQLGDPAGVGLWLRALTEEDADRECVGLARAPGAVSEVVALAARSPGIDVGLARAARNLWDRDPKIFGPLAIDLLASVAGSERHYQEACGVWKGILEQIDAGDRSRNLLRHLEVCPPPRETLSEAQGGPFCYVRGAPAPQVRRHLLRTEGRPLNRQEIEALAVSASATAGSAGGDEARHAAIWQLGCYGQPGAARLARLAQIDHSEGQIAAQVLLALGRPEAEDLLRARVDAASSCFEAMYLAADVTAAGRPLGAELWLDLLARADGPGCAAYAPAFLRSRDGTYGRFAALAADAEGLGYGPRLRALWERDAGAYGELVVGLLAAGARVDVLAAASCGALGEIEESAPEALSATIRTEIEQACAPRGDG